VGSLSPIEKWLYFLLHAEHMDAEDLASQLSEPAFAEAVGVLQMISRTPEDLQFYEARQKFLHDEQARLLAARQEGREEGREEGLIEGREEGERTGIEKGRLAGKIQLLLELLGEPPTADAELQFCSDDTLKTRLNVLQQRLRDRQA